MRIRQLSLTGSLAVAIAAVLVGSLSAAAGSPASSGSPAATEQPPEQGLGPIYQTLVEARGGVEPAIPGPLSIDDIRRILTAESEKDLFDGVVQGWRLAPDDILEAEGLLGRHLSRDCKPQMVEPDVPTDLDFSIGHIPTNVKVQDTQLTKWVCDGEALSVTYLLAIDTPLGQGTLMVYRAVWGQRSLDLLAPEDRVTEGAINGAPAVFVEPAEPQAGLGTGQIIVIEDDTEPEYQVLRVFADNGIPFDELINIAEAIR